MHNIYNFLLLVHFCLTNLFLFTNDTIFIRYYKITNITKIILNLLT